MASRVSWVSWGKVPAKGIGSRLPRTHGLPIRMTAPSLPSREPLVLVRRRRLRDGAEERTTMPGGDASPGTSTGIWVTFDRATWAALRAATPLTLDDHDLDELRGMTTALDLAEVTDIYLPLSRLLNLYVSASKDLHRVSDVFLGGPADKVPFILGIAGSVAVGKSTTARVLKALLSRWPDHPRVALVTTDGFLKPCLLYT